MCEWFAGKKQVIMCWFVTFVRFRPKWLKLLTIIFLSPIDEKQQQNDRKLCVIYSAEIRSYLGFVSNF